MSPQTKQTKHTTGENSLPTGTNLNETPENQSIRKVKTQAIERTQGVTPDDFLRLAIESKADPAILDKWMDLKIKWDANEARKAYVVAMARFQASCPNIFKTKQGHNAKYAPLGPSIDQIKPIEAECGLMHSWRTSQHENGSITVVCRVTHTAGHFEDTSLTAPPDTSGNKNGIQGIGSTVFYLERYTLFALLGLAPQDMDNDGNGNGGPKEPVSQQRLIDMLIRDACQQYGDKKRPVLSADSEIDPGKFKEQLRSHFSALPDEQRKKFEWNKNSIDSLAADRCQ